MLFGRNIFVCSFNRCVQCDLGKPISLCNAFDEVVTEVHVDFRGANEAVMLDDSVELLLMLLGSNPVPEECGLQ